MSTKRTIDGGRKETRKTQFVLVLNNPRQLEKEAIPKLASGEGCPFSYFCYGGERGESGTPHLQCTGRTKNPISIAALQKCITRVFGFPSRFAIQTARCNLKKNIQYCQKGEQPHAEWLELNELGPNFGKNADFHEFGVPPKGQGKRTDIDVIVDYVKEGKSEFDIATDFGKEYMKYHRGVGALIDQIQCSRPRKDFTYGYWFHGPTGTGKSKAAFEIPGGIYSKPAETQWFDLYRQEETVVIDEYRSSHQITFSYLLRLADSNPLIIQRKGSSMQFNSSRIVVTAPLSIQNTFAHLEFLKEGDIAQLRRRFQEVVFSPERTVEENTRIAHLMIKEREEKQIRDVPVEERTATFLPCPSLTGI